MKKYLLGMIAVLLAIGFSAFTTPKAHNSKPLAGEKWFHFVGDATSDIDLEDPDMYELDGTGATPSVCFGSDDYRCEIQIVPQDGGVLPDLGFEPIAETFRHTAQ